MALIIITGAFMFLIYLVASWLGVPDSYCLQAALWGGGIFGILGIIVRWLGKAATVENSPSQKIDVPLGRYTAGFSGDTLTPTDGGRSHMYCRLAIGYADAKNAVTTRVIDVLSFTVAATPDGEVVAHHLTAYCEMRKAQRNFRADRIVECHTAEANDDASSVKDLLSTLMAAPETTAFDNQMAILHPVTMADLVLDYMARSPNYKRITIQPVACGYMEKSRGNLREKTILFIDGIAEGKSQQQRFKIDRIRTIWMAGSDEPVTNIAGLFLTTDHAN